MANNSGQYYNYNYLTFYAILYFYRYFHFWVYMQRNATAKLTLSMTKMLFKALQELEKPQNYMNATVTL